MREVAGARPGRRSAAALLGTDAGGRRRQRPAAAFLARRARSRTPSRSGRAAEAGTPSRSWRVWCRPDPRDRRPAAARAARHASHTRGAPPRRLPAQLLLRETCPPPRGIIEDDRRGVRRPARCWHRLPSPSGGSTGPYSASNSLSVAGRRLCRSRIASIDVSGATTSDPSARSSISTYSPTGRR